MDPPDELVQVAERQLADAEEAYRRDPSDQNQRRIMRAWSDVRRAREAQDASEPKTNPRDPSE